MRRIATAVSIASGLALALASPGFAQTVSVGNHVAGPLSENVTVAGDADLLLDAPAPPSLPFGTDVALAGNPVLPNAFPEGVNLSFIA